MKLGESNTVNSSSEGFRAFVSYSHADAKIARKLHRKMESYRLPSRLRDRHNGAASGRSDGRIGKIFRDREDLPAAQDLSQAVKNALAKSQALIVLCSPDAKSSPWVAQEILLFRSLHPDRPILAAIVRGAPEEAFPAPLLEGKEPLAADLRKEGDGWRLGFLKIVAGIAGIPLDALVQRDAQQRIRRVTAITSGALVALLAMIGMTIFAIQSRNEAQRQQAEAEGLVEYMLTDLRDELKGVGRLDVMTKVNERAMDYYEDSELSDMLAESLERRARILHAMGEDDEKRGDLDKALAKFAEARRVTDTLLARDPENPDRIFGHAQSEYWVGYIAYLKKDWDLSEHHWNAYRTMAEQMVSIEPENPKWLQEAGYSEGNVCTLYVETEASRDRTIASCMAALSRMEQLANLVPDDLKVSEMVANRHAWVADAYQKFGAVEDAFRHRMLQVELIDRMLAIDPNNKDTIDFWLTAQFSVAKLEDAIGKSESGNLRLNEAENVARRLSSFDPRNKQWKKRVSEIQKAREILSN